MVSKITLTAISNPPPLAIVSSRHRQRTSHTRVVKKCSEDPTSGQVLIHQKTLFTMAESEAPRDKAAAEAAARIDRAVAVIKGEGVTGVINFDQRTPEVPMTISGTVQGLPPGKHGISINEYGDSSRGCKSTGNHFNPSKKEHGGPSDKVRHLGDLGNIEADADGAAMIDITDKFLSLNGKNSIIGRSIVIYESPDDLGKGGNRAVSKKTGCSGKGLAMGVIGIQKI